MNMNTVCKRLFFVLFRLITIVSVVGRDSYYNIRTEMNYWLSQYYCVLYLWCVIWIYPTIIRKPVTCYWYVVLIVFRKKMLLAQIFLGLLLRPCSLILWFTDFSPQNMKLEEENNTIRSDQAAFLLMLFIMFPKVSEKRALGSLFQAHSRIEKKF